MNQLLIQRLRDGEVCIHHSGSVIQLNQVLQAAFPNSRAAQGGSCYYFKNVALPQEGWTAGSFRPATKECYDVEEFLIADPVQNIEFVSGEKVNCSDDGINWTSVDMRYIGVNPHDNRYVVNVHGSPQVLQYRMLRKFVKPRVKVTLEQIAEKFKTTVDNLDIEGLE